MRQLIPLMTVAVALVVVGVILTGSLGGSQFLLGAGVVAGSLGARHAFDADHIAAIDGATRALIARGRRPSAVGFFFSLGHSTVVIVMTAVVALGSGAIGTWLFDPASPLRQVGDVVGTVVSAAFLLVVAALGVRAIRRLQRGDRPGSTALLSRLLHPMLARIGASWQIYPVGLLFGLGFDTATEIALLAVAAHAAAQASLIAVLGLPLLFTGTMCAFDTLDGWAISRIYGWARSRARRRRFDFAVTAVGTAVAGALGVAEVASLAARSMSTNPRGADDFDPLDPSLVGVVVALTLLGLWITWVVVDRGAARRAGGEDRDAFRTI